MRTEYTSHSFQVFIIVVYLMSLRYYYLLAEEGATGSGSAKTESKMVASTRRKSLR